MLYDYIKYAMCIDDPRQCREYIAMEEQLMKNKNVSVRKIV